MKKDTARTRAFYVSPEVMCGFADALHKSQLHDYMILGSTSSGLMIVAIVYGENDASINELLKIDCHHTREIGRAEALNYNFSIPLMGN